MTYDIIYLTYFVKAITHTKLKNEIIKVNEFYMSNNETTNFEPIKNVNRFGVLPSY